MSNDSSFMDIEDTDHDNQNSGPENLPIQDFTFAEEVSSQAEAQHSFGMQFDQVQFIIQDGWEAIDFSGEGEDDGEMSLESDREFALPEDDY